MTIGLAGTRGKPALVFVVPGTKYDPARSKRDGPAGDPGAVARRATSHAQFYGKVVTDAIDHHRRLSRGSSAAARQIGVRYPTVCCGLRIPLNLFSQPGPEPEAPTPTVPSV